MELADVVERAKKSLADVTGLKPVAVIRAFKDSQGWHIGVEMLEMARIPPATDVLGEYEALLSEQSEMIRFERKRTRLRGEAKEQEES